MNIAGDVNVAKVKVPCGVVGKKHAIKQDTFRPLLGWFCPVVEEENFTTEQVNACLERNTASSRTILRKILDKHLEC